MNMKLIILSVLVSVVVSNSSLDWAKFKRDYNKQYKTIQEEIERKQIFLENANLVRNYARLHPNATFTVGINHLADRRVEELVTSSKRYIEFSSETMPKDGNSMQLPDSLDWRTKGVITRIKDQGSLGSSDAFASVEVIETLYAIQTGKLVEGSPARVADCCPQPVDPFQCISKLGGICAEGDYPKPTGQCVPNACKPFANFDKLMRLKNRNEDIMVTWIQNSTLFVGIDASRSSFQLYQGGIYDDQSCSKTAIDHTMQLVGYGKTDTGELYWILKNTWGLGWGEQGYIRILRGQNICGIASYVIQVA